MRRCRKRRSGGGDLLVLAGIAAAAWVGYRCVTRRGEEKGSTAESPADLLRRLVVSESPGARAATLKRYQRSEGLAPSGRWDVATAAAAENRLSAFVPSARELLARGIGSDPFFKVGDLVRPPN